MANQPDKVEKAKRLVELYLAPDRKKQKKREFRGVQHFYAWLKVCPFELDQLNWQSLIGFHRHLIEKEYGRTTCQKIMGNTKTFVRWAIEQKHLKQEVDSLYVSSYSGHKWTIKKLPKISEEFLYPMKATKPLSYKKHSYVQKIFHIFLKENKLNYRQLKQEDFVNFSQYLKDHNLSLQSRVTITTRVKAYLKWLYSKRKIARSPEELLPHYIMPKKECKLPRPIQPEVDQKMQEILNKSDDIYYKAILLLRKTGMRISELQLMEFECVQTDTKGRRSIKVPAVKLGLQRMVPIDQETYLLILNIQKMSVKNLNNNKTKPQRLVISHYGTYPPYWIFSHTMAEICAKLNVKKWINLHALRHTYATSLLSAGLSIISLKEILGHKSINMSLLYAKVTQSKVHQEYNEAMLKMDDKLMPKVLSKKPSLTCAFKQINDDIKKKLDQANDSDAKKLKALQNRISKIKMELKKI